MPDIFDQIGQQTPQNSPTSNAPATPVAATGGKDIFDQIAATPPPKEAPIDTVPSHGNVDWSGYAKSIMSSFKDNPNNTPKWAQEHPDLYGALGAAREALGPVVEALGMGGGAAVGTTAGGPGGGVVGAGLGYAGAKQLLSAVDEFLGNKPPSSMSQAASQAVQDTVTGGAMEAGGQVVGVAAPKVIKAVGQGAKELLGATTGSGPGMVEEAVKSGERTGFRPLENITQAPEQTEFVKAMRGKTTGNEIVDNVKDALYTLKDQRSAAYKEQLAKLSQNKNNIDISPIMDKYHELVGQYWKEGRTPLNNAAQKDITEIANLLDSWGSSPIDKTPVGLDILKRNLDDFYSDSSQARQFVTALRNTVKDTIVNNVPEYAEMTKGYSEATSLIKDMESGLMLKKQGLTGQVTGDMTLRRLTSAMRENFELRRGLVDTLGEKTGQDLAGQIAGYSASQLKPRGLAGTGPALGIEAFAALKFLNPKFWPLLAASSPRAVGEFLNIYGKGLVEMKNMAPAAYKTLAFEGMKSANEENNQ